MVVAGVVLLTPWVDRSRDWPAWFGGLVAALGLALGLAALQQPHALSERLGRPARALAIGVALLIGLATLQTLPLGEALAWLSPATVEARRPFVVDAGPSCLSLDAHLTRTGALAWGGAAVVALLAARVGPPRRLCAALLAGGVLQVLVALPQVGAATRAHGTFVSPNNFAALLALLLPVALALSGVGQRVAPTGWRRALPLAAAGLLALGLVASRSRSGVMAAGVAVAVYVALVGAARGRRAVWVAGVVLLLLLLAGADLTLARFGRLAAGEETDRLTLWAVGWQIFVRFPLLGAGLRSHPALTPELLEQPRLLYATHNDYINLLADCGLVGGALAVGAVASWALAVRHGLDLLPWGGERRGLLAACAAAAAGMAAASVVEFGLQVTAVLWTFAALAGIAAGGDPAATGRPGRRRAAWTRALRWTLGLAALCLTFQGARLTLSRLALDRARDPGAELALRSASFARAARLWPEQGTIDLEWGRALRAAGDPKAARLAFARACRKSPRDPWAHLELAGTRKAGDRGSPQETLGAPGEGRDHADRLAAARRLAPHDPEVRLEAGRLSLAHGERDPGLTDLRLAVAARPELLGQAVAAVLALPDVAVADCEALLTSADLELRRRCVGELEVHSPGPARLLLQPLLVPGGEPDDFARAARLELRLGRPELARAAWLDAARALPDPGELLARAALELDRAGRLDQAESLLVDATVARADAPGAWRELGRLLLRTRRPVEARAALKQALTLDPRVGGLELGATYEAQGQRETALLAWQQALDAGPERRERAQLHFRMARAQLAQGHVAEAATSARAALAADPEHGSARELLADLQARPR